MKKTAPYIQLSFIMILLFSFFNELKAQDHHHEILENKIRISTSLGHAYIPDARSIDGKFVVVPTWGLDFQYWFNSKLALGFKNDLEIATYYLNTDTDVIKRKNPFISTLNVFYKPFENELALFIGPGIEFTDDLNFFIFRFGLEYEINLSNGWDVSPELIYDLKDNHINSLTLAIAFGKSF